MANKSGLFINDLLNRNKKIIFAPRMKSTENKEDNAWYSTWFDSPFYHILYQHRNEDEAQRAVADLLELLAVAEGSTIMDLCCGKGRHSVFLAQAGHYVTGLDLSPSNIAHCKLSENDRLKFAIHDMRETYTEQQFDFIFNLFTSFGYFDHDGNEKTLKAAMSALKPQGKMLIDFLNVIPVLNSLPITEEKTIDGIHFQIQKNLDNNKIVKHINFEHEGINYSFSEEVNALQLHDFQRYFENTAIELIAVYGDYNGEAFRADSSKRLILLIQSK